MLNRKKYFLLLLAVPLYVCCLYIGALFGGSFSLREITSFSVFVIAATAVLTIRSRSVRIVCFLVLHLAFFVLAFYDVRPFYIAREQLVLYGIYQMPTLLLLELVVQMGLPRKNETGKKEKEKNRSDITAQRFLFDAYLLILTVWLAVRFINGTQLVKRAFDGVGFSFLLLAVFFVFSLFQVGNRNMKESVKKSCVSVLVMLFVSSIFSAVTYVLSMNQYAENQIEPIFPLFLSAVVFFDKIPAAKEAVFRGVLSQQR